MFRIEYIKTKALVFDQCSGQNLYFTLNAQIEIEKKDELSLLLTVPVKTKKNLVFKKEIQIWYLRRISTTKFGVVHKRKKKKTAAGPILTFSTISVAA